jgi:hypothetical protein
MSRLLSLMVILLLATSGSVLVPTQAQNMSREFHTDLSAGNQTRLTISPASGTTDLVLDLTTLTLSWDVRFKDLISKPTAATLNGPSQPGANGLPYIDLAPNGIVSPLTGSAVLNEAEVQYLLTGWSYVNITTEKWPFGEVRGQLDVGPRQ